MAPCVSLLFSQEPTDGPYPEPREPILPVSYYLLFTATSTYTKLSHITPFCAFSNLNLYAFLTSPMPTPYYVTRQSRPL
jgi:hypothetical protein